MEGIGVQILADFIHGVVRGHELAAVGEINAIDAGVHVGRTTDGDVNFAGAGVLEGFHAGTGGGAADNGVVHNDHAFVLHEGFDEIELHADVEVADELGGLEEAAADVMVADEGHFVGDAGFFGVAHGGADAGVGHGNDDVGLDVVLAGELAAHFLADFIDGVAVDDGVGAGKIDVLENAEGALGLLGEGLDAGEAFFVDDNDFAGENIAHELGVDEVEGGGFAGEHPGAIGGAADGEGRKPWGSRAPMSSRSVMMTRE